MMSREIDPHKIYLNIVFAWADRLRAMDPAAVARRYELDSPALTSAPDDSREPGSAERLLRMADEQRAEMQQHLDALVGEYVSGGVEYGVALVKAQQALGEPRALGRQIAWTTAHEALGSDARWLAFLRWQDWLPLGICIAMLSAAIAWPLSRLALLAANTGLMASFAFISGYAAGWMISPDSRSFTSRFIPILEVMEGDRLLSVRQTTAWLKRSHRLVLNAERSRPFWWVADCFSILIFSYLVSDAIHGSAFHLFTSGFGMAFAVSSFAQSCGVRLGKGRRLAHSARRVS